MQLGATSFDPNDRAAILQEQVQKMRMADAELHSEARRIQAQATADGQTVTTQLTYGRGPNGQSYATSITITRTATVTVGESLATQEANRLVQPLPQTMEAISPARMPLTPSDMAEGFAAQMKEAGQGIAEGLALNELQHADSGVRNHEGLHFRTAGGLAAGLPELEYIQGPDGQYYAVAGEVRVRTGATTDPEKASRDAVTYARAATAPGDASAQDMSAARNAHAHATDTYGKALASRTTPSFTGFELVA